MALAISIYVLLFFLVICSVKVFYEILANRIVAEQEYSSLQNQLIKELNKQKIICQESRLVEDLNNSLMQRLFKIVSDLLLVKEYILKKQFE